MPRLRRLVSAALLIGTLALSPKTVAAPPQGAQEKLKNDGSATPVAALQRLEQAMKAGDLDACAAAMADPVGPVMQQSFDAAKQLGEAKRKLAAALDTRFGRAGGGAEGNLFSYIQDDAPLRAQLQQLVGLTITEQRPDGEQFNLMVTTTVRTPQGVRQIRQGFAAIPQGGKWKVVPISHVRNLAARRVRLANTANAARALAALAQEVTAGKYASRQEAERAAHVGYDVAMGINQPLKPGQELYQRGQKLYLAKDMKGAFALFLDSVRAGYVPGQRQTAWHYEFGEGVAQNYAEAARWYRLAADQGDRIAQNNLGSLYRDGTGVQRNPATALHWFGLSAAQDYPNAMYNIGRMHLFGDGLPQSREQAIAWFRKAAVLGDSMGAYFADHLKNPMNVAFRDDAERNQFLRVMNLQHRAALAEAGAIEANKKGDLFEKDRELRQAAALRAQAERIERESKSKP